LAIIKRQSLYLCLFPAPLTGLDKGQEMDLLDTGGKDVKTYMAKPGEIVRSWYVIDATNQTLGRLSSEVAAILRGKHKPTYTPHVDTGDFVIVINADKIQLTGNKLDQKKYRRHSGYPGGLKETSYRDLMQKKPEKAVEIAVKGMLPKNRLGAKMIKKLKVYRGDTHPHQAQKPIVYELRG
jgi:large subunit ribosomal protein L13